VRESQKIDEVAIGRVIRYETGVDFTQERVITHEKSWFHIFVTSTRSSFPSNQISVRRISDHENVSGSEKHKAVFSNWRRGMSFTAYTII
jgi:hypothetical protein